MRAFVKALLLLPLFVVYIVLGAYSFLALEDGPSVAVRNEFFQYLALFTDNHSRCVSSEELVAILQQAGVARAKGVISASTVADEGGVVAFWSWPNSIVFAATILTTVGYGRLVPITVGGKIFCIVFAIVGIPLCYTMLSVVGDTFQSLWHQSIRLFDKAVACVKSRRTRKALGGLVTFVIVWMFVVTIPAIIFSNTETWSLIDAEYFSFISLSTIGFGDLIYGMEDRQMTVKQDWLYKTAMLIYFLLGLSIISIVFKGVWRAQKERIKRAEVTTRRFWKARAGRHGSYSLGSPRNVVEETQQRHERGLFKRKQSSVAAQRPDADGLGESSEDETIEATMSMDAMERNRRRSTVFALSYRTSMALRNLADTDSGHGSCNQSFIEDTM